MNPEPTTSVTLAAPAPLHCQHRSPSGRRCRMAVSGPHSDFCLRHAAHQTADLNTANLAVMLIGNVQEFRSATDINHFLGELLNHLARNEIAPRRAAVMAYTCNLLLRTLPAIEHQEKSDDDHTIIVDFERPETRDHWLEAQSPRPGHPSAHGLSPGPQTPDDTASRRSS